MPSPRTSGKTGERNTGSTLIQRHGLLLRMGPPTRSKQHSIGLENGLPRTQGEDTTRLSKGNRHPDGTYHHQQGCD
jgi:hypothetical protein